MNEYQKDRLTSVIKIIIQAAPIAMIAEWV
jgi:hypothetical protein